MRTVLPSFLFWRSVRSSHSFFDNDCAADHVLAFVVDPAIVAVPLCAAAVVDFFVFLVGEVAFALIAFLVRQEGRENTASLPPGERRPNSVHLAVVVFQFVDVERGCS
jgi:hypothetical protein